MMDKIGIEFSAFSEKFSVNEFTKSIKIIPTETYNMYDKVYVDKLYPIRKETAWCYNLYNKKMADVDSVIQQFLDIFNSKQKELRYLKMKFDLEYSIRVVIFTNDDVISNIKVSSNIFAFMSGIGAWFEVLIY